MTHIPPPQVPLLTLALSQLLKRTMCAHLLPLLSPLHSLPKPLQSLFSTHLNPTQTACAYSTMTSTWPLQRTFSALSFLLSRWNLRRVTTILLDALLLDSAIKHLPGFPHSFLTVPFQYSWQLPLPLPTNWTNFLRAFSWALFSSLSPLCFADRSIPTVLTLWICWHSQIYLLFWLLRCLFNTSMRMPHRLFNPRP